MIDQLPPEVLGAHPGSRAPALDDAIGEPCAVPNQPPNFRAHAANDRGSCNLTLHRRRSLSAPLRRPPWAFPLRARRRQTLSARPRQNDVPVLARSLALLAPLLLSGCLGAMPVPMGALDRSLEAIGSSHSPALGDRWLALIGGRGGREQVVLVDLERQMPVPLPGLNRPDAQPLAVAVDARGERLAVVRQLEGRTELVLYRRSLMALEPVAMEPAGVPRRISLRADGRELAVEVSRGGVWQVDLIEVP